MARSGLFTNAAIGALLVVPAVTLQGPTADSLEESLRRTLHALEALAGLEPRVAQGEREAVDALLASTEPALPDAQQRDALLVSLRTEVSALERELDALHTPVPGHGSQLPPRTDAAPPGEHPPVAATTGLDDATRRLLAGRGAPIAGTPPTPPGGASTSREPAHKQSFEAPGYAADPLRLARAHYRQGRWHEALALLEGRDTTPAETYWRARCLEKLERNTEAIEAYERVLAAPAGGWEAERAREDLEFLRWRLEFVRKRAAAGARKDVR